jgi:hypothetical protein
MLKEDLCNNPVNNRWHYLCQVVIRFGQQKMQFCLTYIELAQEGQIEEKKQKGIQL